MKVHDLIQGTPAWLAYRAQHFNASDAPAMMGCSPYKTRAELLREMHTGVVGDVDIATQKRFDNGHRVEALARPLAEQTIGEDLFPVTGSLQVPGIKRGLSASFDGLTLAEDQGFEHKALAEPIRAAFRAMADMGPSDDAAPGRLLPIYHRVQMEQQLLVSGAERILFMSSEWTADGDLADEVHCWYYPDAELRQQIIDGWAQFERDLAAYVLPEAAEPAPVGKAPETLPALRIEVTGKVTASNLAEFKETALAAIRSVNRTLKTDQDFADAAKAVKWCSEVEERLQAAKEHALSQTASIDALFKAIDDISAEARRVRLDLDKLVTRRKTEVKEEAVSAARVLLDKHIADLNGELAPMRLQPVPVDFAGAIKGLRSFDSMQAALDTALANAKIAADGQARVVRANVGHFKDATGDDRALQALFADLGNLVHKQHDDFVTLVDARIAKHRADEQAREAKRQADEEARIEAAKAQARADEAARIERERQQEESKRIERENDQAAALRTSLVPAPAPAPAVVAAPAPSLFAPGVVEAVRAQASRPAPTAGLQSIPVADVVALQQRILPRADEPATLKLGVISERLGFTVSAAFLADVLHIQAAGRDRSAVLYRESQWPLICSQLIAHVGAMADLYAPEVV